MAILNKVRTHYVYDGNNNIIKSYVTDENHDSDGGECVITKYSYNLNKDVENEYTYSALEWNSAWNLDKS